MKLFVYLIFSIVHALSKRASVGAIICPGETVFAAGTNTFVNSLPLTVEKDSYLQAFVAPMDSTLCSLSFSMEKPLTEVSVRLDIYDDTTPQINVVNGIATPLASVSVFSSGNVVNFPFCSKEQSLKSGSVYSMSISLMANSARLKFNFGDASSQGIFYGPSFGAQGQVQNAGLTFNLTAGTSKPSCATASIPPASTSKTTTSTSKTTTSTSKTTTSSTKSSKTKTKSSTTTTTTTSTRTTSTSTSSKPTTSPVVYCLCNGEVEFDGHLQKRELNGNREFDLENIGQSRNSSVDVRVNKRQSLFQRSSSSRRYSVEFTTKCGHFICKCERLQKSIDYVSNNDLEFSHFGTC